MPRSGLSQALELSAVRRWSAACGIRFVDSPSAPLDTAQARTASSPSRHQGCKAGEHMPTYRIEKTFRTPQGHQEQLLVGLLVLDSDSGLLSLRLPVQGELRVILDTSTERDDPSGRRDTSPA